MKRVRSRVIILSLTITSDLKQSFTFPVNEESSATHINDSGSLVGGRLLGLSKLRVGLGFGRTFLIFVEGGTYSTGF